MTSIRKPYTTKTRTEILEYLKEHASSTVSVADIQNYLKENGQKPILPPFTDF